MFNGEKFSVWVLFSIPYQFNGFEKPYQIRKGNTVAEADFFTHSPLSMWKISKSKGEALSQKAICEVSLWRESLSFTFRKKL
jgi:hypothetical protein